MTAEPVMRAALGPAPAGRLARCRSAGFTLLELLVTLTIGAVLAAMAVPAFGDAVLNSRLTSFSNDMVATVLLARGEAIKRNAVVTLCPSSDGASCATGSWEQGYVAKCAKASAAAVNCDPTGLGTGVLVLSYQPGLNAGFKIVESGALTALNFQPTGTGATAATLTFCRLTPTVSSRQRVLRISVSGRPSVTRSTGATSCP